MSTLRILCFGLALLLAGIDISIPVAKAEIPPESQSVELRTYPNYTNFGKFDGHGKLVSQELYQDDYPADWHNTYVYYPRGSRKSVKLKRDVSAINVFLAAEVRRPKTARIFTKENLTFFLTANLGDGPSIITRRQVELGLGSNPYDNDPQFLVPEHARLRAKIRPYACSGDPLVKSNGWTVDINVLTDDGAVEHWLVKGQVSPMRIDSFQCEPKEPNGTFHPNVRIR